MKGFVMLLKHSVKETFYRKTTTTACDRTACVNKELPDETFSNLKNRRWLAWLLNLVAAYSWTVNLKAKKVIGLKND